MEIKNGTYCRFNKLIDCLENNCVMCNSCGWNPVVAKERVNEWKKNWMEEHNKNKSN